MMKITKQERIYFWAFVLAALCLSYVLDGRNPKTVPSQQEETLNEYARYATAWSGESLGHRVESNVFCSIDGSCSVTIEGTQSAYNLTCSHYTQTCVREIDE